MQARAAAAEATRSRILAAAHEQFLTRWFDEVTLQDVAREAGVSAQTVINHFGGKEGLFLAVGDVVSEEIRARRTVAPGDAAGAVEAIVDDYEVTGDAVVRALALEERIPALRPLMARGRTEHRAWIVELFGEGARVPALLVATDVQTWKHLRRDQGLDRAATVAAMRRLVDGVLTTPDTTEERSG